MAAVLLAGLFFLAVVAPLILVLLATPFTDHSFLYELGKAFALTGFMILVLQFVLSSRRKWIERPFGLDIVFRCHKGMAALAGILILMHPVLLAAGSGNYGLIASVSQPWNILLGKLGLLLILLQVFAGFFRVPIGLGFEKWRLAHNYVGVLLVAGAFIHSIVTSHNDLESPLLRTFWICVFAAALLFYAHHKFILPAKLRRRPFTVSGVNQETHNVWTLEMTPPEGEKRFEYHPGQFHFITLHRNRNLPEEEHHFTISSSPTRPGIVASSIKESGDFTSTIGQTREGDKVSVEAPFGRFSHLFHPEDRNFVFITGGIGITPVMGMLRYMRDRQSEFFVLLINANHTEEDIVFRKELDEMAAGGYPKLSIVYVLDKPGNNWEGEAGFIDEALLGRHISSVSGKAFYICCPPAMRKSVLKTLNRMGVKSSRIRLEIFSL